MPDYSLKIQYSEVKYAKKRKGEYTNKTEFSDLEKREIGGLSALEGIAAITGIFSVLLNTEFTISLAEKEDAPIDSYSFGILFRNFAELGLEISENCYANLFECLEGYETLMKEVEGNKNA